MQPSSAPEVTADETILPSFSEQVAQQLGGLRGLIESSIPLTLFILVNFLGDRYHWWSLRTSLIIAVSCALAIAAYRLSRRESIRHALNGVFGIGIGALLALRSGDARDFYLPGILLAAAYGVALFGSVAFRRPIVGWIWSVMADGGGTRWRDEPRLTRLFGWLTVFWGTMYMFKVALQTGLYLAHETDLLGIARLALGWPPYILLAALTVWRVRRLIPNLQPVPPAQPIQPA
jgi:hypothetical protein